MDKQEIVSKLKNANARYIDLGQEYEEAQRNVEFALAQADLIIEQRRAIMQEIVELQEELADDERP